MNSLYAVFKRSPRKWAECRQLADVLEEDIVKRVRSSGTIWIGDRKRALAALSQNYETLCSFFQKWSTPRPDVSSTEAARMKEFSIKLRDEKLKFYFAVYNNIVDELSTLPDALQ